MSDKRPVNSGGEPSPDLPADFLGAFAVVRRGDTILFVSNDRCIAGKNVRMWDLPGGQVEQGELLEEALAREVHEETGLVVTGAAELLFIQDGERLRCGQRVQTWRSFFFAVTVAPGEPLPGHEVRDVTWLAAGAMRAELTAPYHGSFLQWLAECADPAVAPSCRLHYCTWAD